MSDTESREKRWNQCSLMGKKKNSEGSSNTQDWVQGTERGHQPQHAQSPLLMPCLNQENPIEGQLTQSACISYLWQKSKLEVRGEGLLLGFQTAMSSCVFLCQGMG